MLKIRNLIREETGVRLRLSEEGAVEHFLNVCAASDNVHLRHCGEQLRAMIDLQLVEYAGDLGSPVRTETSTRRRWYAS